MGTNLADAVPSSDASRHSSHQQTETYLRLFNYIIHERDLGESQICLVSGTQCRQQAQLEHPFHVYAVEKANATLIFLVPRRPLWDPSLNTHLLFGINIKKPKKKKKKKKKNEHTRRSSARFVWNLWTQSKCESPFILNRNCVAVPIYQLLSAASHRSITAFQIKTNLTFMRYRNAVHHMHNFYAGRCSAATQLNCGGGWTDLNTNAEQPKMANPQGHPTRIPGKYLLLN